MFFRSTSSPISDLLHTVMPAIVRWGTAGIFVLFLVFLGGCDKFFGGKESNQETIFAPVRAQVKALNRRDAEGALAVMHPEAPGLTETRATTQQVTATYDLIFMIQSLKVDSVTPEEARVHFTQVTQKVAGPEFRNNRVVGIHTLRKFQNAWRIYSTEVESIDYLP